MKLSIIITTCADNDECRETCKSIRATSGDEPEIIVVDDCSPTPMSAGYLPPELNVRIISNAQRCGCGPSRQIGALHATGDWLLIIDSHMRFENGWYDEDNTIRGGDMDSYPNTIYCATCLALDSQHMDPNNPVSAYHGATMNFYGPDRGKPDTMQVFEAVWLPKDKTPNNGDEIPAIMGAAYFISKDWFLHLGATRFLRSWGCDEQMLSLKSWLAGGECRMLKSVRIGHKFLLPGEHQGWRPPMGHVVWNKAFAISTLFKDDGLRNRMLDRLWQSKESRDVEAAKQLLVRDYHIVGQERAYNASILKHDINWYSDKFQIALP